MNSYHVYFTAKKGMTELEVTSILARFVESEIKDNLMLDARVLKMTNKASFPDFPDYHSIVDYRNESDRTEAMERMKKRYREEPHASLMKMVSDFRVAFSEDLNIKAVPAVAGQSGQGATPEL